MAEPSECPVSTTLPNDVPIPAPLRNDCTTWCTACACVVAVTSALRGLVLLPVPNRSTANVAYPAAFIASRYEYVAGWNGESKWVEVYMSAGPSNITVSGVGPAGRHSVPCMVAGVVSVVTATSTSSQV